MCFVVVLRGQLHWLAGMKFKFTYMFVKLNWVRTRHGVSVG